MIEKEKKAMENESQGNPPETQSTNNNPEEKIKTTISDEDVKDFVDEYTKNFEDDFSDLKQEVKISSRFLTSLAIVKKSKSQYDFEDSKKSKTVLTKRRVNHDSDEDFGASDKKNNIKDESDSDTDV